MSFPWSAPTRPLIGMLHLDPLPGSPGSPGFEALLARARADLLALAEGGASAAMLENWKDESPGPFVDPATSACLGALVARLAPESPLPLGVNVLPNDYRTAFALVPLGVEFVWLDVFADRVETDYAYSAVPPFRVEVDLADLTGWRSRTGEQASLFASVHPKHYRLLDAADPLDLAAQRALAAGADALVVTGSATGSAPDPARVAEVRAAAGPRARVVVGSGVRAENVTDLAQEADAVIVGSSLKADLDAPVEVARVRALCEALAGLPPRQA